MKYPNPTLGPSIIYILLTIDIVNNIQPGTFVDYKQKKGDNFIEIERKMSSDTY